MLGERDARRVRARTPALLSARSSPHQLRLRCVLKLRRQTDGAAGALQRQSIAVHLAVSAEGVENAVEDSGLLRIGRTNDAVVHPFPLAPGSNDSRAAKVSEMTRDFWLRLVENFHEITNAELPFGHQVQQAQPGAISERLKQSDGIILHRFSIHSRTQIRSLRYRSWCTLPPPIIQKEECNANPPEVSPMPRCVAGVGDCVRADDCDADRHGHH